MALQNHLLRECVLHTGGNDSDDCTAPVPKTVITEPLSDLQTIMLTFSSNVFKGGYEVIYYVY